MRTHLHYLALGISLLAACGDDPPPAPSTVRARIAADLPHVLAASKAAFDGSQGAVPALPPQLGLGMAAATLRYPALAPFLARTATHTRARPDTGTTTTDTFDPDAEARWLNDHIFTDANQVEPGVYRVPADLACTTTALDGTPMVDAACATKFDAMQLRIRVEDNAATLRFAIQLDANHDEPLAVTLRHDALGASVNLDGADAAMTALAPVLGETAPNVAMSGQISAMLEVPGDAHAKLSATIDRDLAVAYGDTGVALDSDAAFRYASAASSVFALDLDGGMQHGSLAIGLGATTAHLPPTDTDASWDLDLPGATATATFAAGQPLAISNVSLGDRTTTVSRGGQLAESIDLDPDDGRAVAFSITGDATGAATTITPKLDLRIARDHAVLGDEPPRFDITQLLASGTIATSATSDQLKVVDGSFAIVTNPSGYGVSLTAGQCGAETDVTDASTGELYTQWVSQTCE